MVFRVVSGEGLQLASTRGHFMQRPSAACANDDFVVAGPKAAEKRDGQIAQRRWRAPSSLDPLELAASLKHNIAAVRRPEWKVGRTLGALQWPRFQVFKRPDP